MWNKIQSIADKFKEFILFAFEIWKFKWGLIDNFQLTFEDEEVAHLLDPETGEINKDNFVAYSLERKLLDAQVYL